MVILAMVVFPLIGLERYAMPLPASPSALAIADLAVAARLYTAQLGGPEAWSAVAWSVAWAVVLVIVGHVALRRGMRRLVLAGR